MKFVFLWIDRPHNIAHRRDELVREIVNSRQLFTISVVVMSRFFLPRDLGQNRNLRQARADVVMQVSRDSRANAFEISKALFARFSQSLLCKFRLAQG